jgi:hypothetical protein
MKQVILIGTLLFSSIAVYAQKIDLQQMLAHGNILEVPGSEAKNIMDGDKQGITAKNNLWLKGIDFGYGTIEVDIRGRNEFLHSFPGIAFHALDTSRAYDLVYFRPFNFRSKDPVRRTWSVQYTSGPEYDYENLRREHKGEFESEILPNPKPEDWIHARIVIGKDSIKVYVNGMDKPSLVARVLHNRDNGMIGLWLDYTTADFANLVITKDK